MSELATRQSTAIAIAEEIAEKHHNARYAGAVVDALRRAHQANPAINQALLMQVTELIEAAELYEAGVKAGEFAAHGGDRKSKSESRTLITTADLDIDKRRIHEGRTLRDRDALAYIEAHLADSIALTSLLRAAQLLLQSEENEWYTPAKYLEAAHRVLGGFDLDPASSERANEAVGALEFYDEKTDGLSQPWSGRVWLNPPYGRLAGAFIGRLVSEYDGGRVMGAVALVNAHCTDTDWFQPLWNHTLCFTDHRIDFDSAGREKRTTSTHGSTFAYLGAEPARFVEEFQDFGAIVRRWS